MENCLQKQIWRLSDMSPLQRERLWPYVLSIAIGAVWLFGGLPLPSDSGGLFGAAVTVASVFGGFLIAAKAILLSLKGGKIFAALRRSGYLDTFVGYLRGGINASALMIVISITSFFIDFSTINLTYPFAERLFYAGWISVSLLALFTYWRVSNNLFKLLTHS